MKYDQNTLPTSGAYTADVAEPEEQPTVDDLIDAANNWQELPAFAKHSVSYRERIYELVNQLLEQRNRYIEECRDKQKENPVQWNKFNAERIHKIEAVYDTLKDFSWRYFGNDKDIFDYFNQLDFFTEKQTKIRLVERDKLAVGEEVW